MARVKLRRATAEDAVWLDLWDKDEDVITCSTDDPNATIAFEDTEWAEELAAQDEHSYYLIAVVMGTDLFSVENRSVPITSGRPIGAMQICDPHLESSHYWGEIAPNLRAIDIWIGSPQDRGKGYGTEMMRLALEHCFADPRVTGIVIDPLASNERAHRFYRRMGFKPIGRRNFGRDDCLVHELTRRDWLARSGA
jgi:aminoglycoside 6'-N-acetyltransferase